jgi:hypothetical protein
VIADDAIRATAKRTQRFQDMLTTVILSLHPSLPSQLPVPASRRTSWLSPRRYRVE